MVSVIDSLQYKSGGGDYTHHPCEERQPPRLEYIVKFCEEATEWLASSHENVVVCHCRSGIGCSATMMACLLLRTKQRDTVLDALQAVADARVQNGDIYKMVTPSQRQYVYNYFYLTQQPGPISELALKVGSDWCWKLFEIFRIQICSTFNVQPRAMRLKKVQLSPVPKFDRKSGCCPRILIYTAYPRNGELYDSSVLYEGHGRIPEFSPVDKHVTMHCIRELNSSRYIMLKGDFKIFFYHQKGKKKTLMLSASLHSNFLSEDIHVIPKQEVSSLHRCSILFRLIKDHMMLHSWLLFSWITLQWTSRKSISRTISS